MMWRPRLPSLFGTTFLGAPTALQLILHDLGFAPVQSDGEILVACCLEWVIKDKVANPDAVVFDPRPWTRIVGRAPEGNHVLVASDTYNNHYTDVTSRLIAARMFQVVHAAQRSMGVGAHATAGPGPHTPGDTAPNLTVSCERGQLERVWEEKTKLTKPKLALQGSDQLMKRQFKLCAGGEIGFIPMKYLVSALPEPGERPWKTAKKTTVDGWDREDEVEERGEPKTNSRGCTRCSATPSSCASSRFRSSASSTSPGMIWRAGTSGSM